MPGVSKEERDLFCVNIQKTNIGEKKLQMAIFTLHLNSNNLKEGLKGSKQHITQLSMFFLIVC